MMVVTKVFLDAENNKMVFPTMFVRPAAPENITLTAVEEAATELQTNVPELTVQAGWYEFDDTAFPHVSIKFADSDLTACVFAGPLFDEVKQEPVPEPVTFLTEPPVEEQPVEEPPVEEPPVEEPPI